MSFVVPVWSETPPDRGFNGLAGQLMGSVAMECERIAVYNGESRHQVHSHRDSIDRWALLSMNAGVARAWNIGWQLSLGEVMVFVNEDVRLPPGVLTPLVDALGNDSSIAAVAPEGSLWATAEVRHVEMVTPPEDGSPVLCDSVVGYAFAVRREALRSIGGFDDRFSPCGGEEVDMCFALRAAGWNIAAVRCSGIQHEWGVSRAGPLRRVEWLGGNESIVDVSDRAERLLRQKWSVSSPPGNNLAARTGGDPRPAGPPRRLFVRARYAIRAIRAGVAHRFTRRGS